MSSFFRHRTATTEIYTLSLHDALPIYERDFAAAATFYERALAVKPDSPDVRTDLGNTFFNRGDLERAIAEYRKSVAVDPNHLNSWKNIAAAALQKGDKATASEAVEHLTKLAPQSQETEAYRQKLSEMP